MKWFLVMFRRWVGKRRAAPTLPAVHLAPEWTDEDRTRLLQFLRNPTGEKFLLRARAVESKNAIAACQDSVTTTHSAARAAGFSDCVEWILSLSCVAHDKATTNSGDEQGELSHAEPTFANT